MPYLGPAQPPAIAGRERPRWWLLIHLSTLALAAVALLWVNRGQWFFGDEWEFVVNRGFVDSRLSLWLPHNEHWSTLPIIAYTLLLDIFGLGSYWPYIALLIALHLLLSHLLWRVMLRAGVHPAIATAGSSLFMLFGAGAENLLWAFQIGFVGSLLAGWAAALVVDTRDRLSRRDGWAVLLLIISLMCSGIGVPCVAFVALLTLAKSRELIRPVVVGGVPAAVFGLWFVLTPQLPKPPWTIAAEGGPAALAAHVMNGLRDSFSSTTNLPSSLGLLVVIAVGIWAVVASVAIAVSRPGSANQAVAVVGFYGAAGFFLLSGFGRPDTSSSRYTYVALAMALPALTLALSQLARPTWARPLAVGTLGVLLVINVGFLRQLAASEAHREQPLRETIIAAGTLIANGEPLVGYQPDPVYNIDVTGPTLTELAARGLPTTPVTAQGLIKARLGLQIAIGDRTDGGAPDDGAAPADLQDAPGMTVTDAPNSDQGRQCVTALATGPDPHLVLLAPGGRSRLTVRSATGGTIAVALADALDAGNRLKSVGAGETTPVWTSLPAGTRIRLNLPSVEAEVCGIRQL